MKKAVILLLFLTMVVFAEVKGFPKNSVLLNKDIQIKTGQLIAMQLMLYHNTFWKGSQFTNGPLWARYDKGTNKIRIIIYGEYGTMENAKIVIKHFLDDLLFDFVQYIRNNFEFNFDRAEAKNDNWIETIWYCNRNQNDKIILEWQDGKYNLPDK